ncbi:MAG: hypothetical protein ACLP7J_06970 [Streptosporangiaceae bacterium]|jgi:capsular polysaccharide biosynthesis protein
MDFKRFLQVLRQYRTVVGVAAVLGLAVGLGFTVARPPLLRSQALVVLSTTRYVQTQVLVAGSTPVLERALPAIHPAVSLGTLRKRVQVSNSSNVLAISAEGQTAAQAVGTANAVAGSYLSYLRSPGSAVAGVMGRMLQPATIGTGTALRTRAIEGGLGAVLGALAGVICALALSRGDKRLRQRGEIADAIGIPVLASVPVLHPSDAADWTRLLEGYQPAAVHSWSLRQALRQLGLTDGAGRPGETSLAILSLACDQGALAMGPQLAAFAASLGVSTALVVDHRQDSNALAALCAACSTASEGSALPSNLRVSVAEHEGHDRLPAAALTIAVTAVDEASPHVADTMRANLTVLAVSAGAVSAEQLARVAASAAVGGRDIAGILVADPDPADNTTGRLPRSDRTTQRRLPFRLPDATTDSVL